MPRVLLTGGSGFIAAHVLDTLLARNYSVVTTVRSQEKADRIREAHPGVGKDKLDFAIVEDIAKLDAFDQAIISDPPFDTVIHTASPFHFKATDRKKELLDPAVNGTVGILHAIKKSAPSVKRVVITSSFASIVDTTQPHSFIFDEKHWNPVTMKEALGDPFVGYRGSKTFAERAAWKFIEEEKPGFTIATINPPAVIGPIVHHLNSLDALNTSNERIRNLITGALKNKNEAPPASPWLAVDVRDVALAHVLAAEKPEAANQRFFIVEGPYTTKEMAETISGAFPEFRDQLPSAELLDAGDPTPDAYTGFNNSKSKKVLGLNYRPLGESVIDAVNSFRALLEKK